MKIYDYVNVTIYDNYADDLSEWGRQGYKAVHFYLDDNGTPNVLMELEEPDEEEED